VCLSQDVAGARAYTHRASRSPDFDFAIRAPIVRGEAVLGPSYPSPWNSAARARVPSRLRMGKALSMNKVYIVCVRTGHKSL
jgi:hypothetical protein